MDEVTADQKQRFAYLTSLVDPDMGVAANDGLHNGMTAAIEKLRQKYGTSPESNDAVDSTVAAASSLRSDGSTTSAVEAEASPSVVAWPSDAGTGGEEEHHRSGSSSSGGGGGGDKGSVGYRGGVVQPSRRISKRLQKKQGGSTTILGLKKSAAVHASSSEYDTEADDEWCVYPGEEMWPLDDGSRGFAPRRATLMKTERTWHDELSAALRGVKNFQTVEVPVGVDPALANVAPELEPDEELYDTYHRGHQIGRAADPATRQLERAAFLVVEDIHDRIRAEMSMLRSYKKLVFYFVSMIALFIVICLQWSIGNSNSRLFTVLVDQLFRDQTRPEWTKNREETVELVGYSKSGIESWLSSNVLDKVFISDVCGDAVCTIPDEYPYFRASPEAREFTGCEADCGSAETKQVVVNLFDPWKLQAAYDQVTNAVLNGWNSGDGSGYLEAESYAGFDSNPTAGWNVCSRNLKEDGFFETVCMFDGDVFIDGLPYRTDELENGNLKFGGSLAFDLFEGAWELRIAWTGFSWSLSRGRGQAPPVEVPIAFPAVRGEICVEQDEGNMDCHAFDPCAAARNCTGEWWEDGIYYQFEPSYFDTWDEKYVGYAQQQNLVHLAKFLLNETYKPHTSLNTSRLDDDGWASLSCKGSGKHRITLTVTTNATNPSDDAWSDETTYDRGWAGYVFDLYMKAPGTGTSFSRLTSLSPTSGLTHVEDIYMCPDETYAVTVSEP